MDTSKPRCKRCNAFIPSPTAIFAAPVVVKDRPRWLRAYDGFVGCAAALGLANLAYHGLLVAYAFARARGYCGE